MWLISGEDCLEIRFDVYEPGEYEYVEISFRFEMEKVGWGAVGDSYFSTKAIAEISVALEKISRHEIKEFHYSDIDPHLIPKPFYWLDIERIDDNNTSFYLKIHDCLDDYIDIKEIVTEEKMCEIRDEFKKAAEDYRVIE